ncbi:MAG: AzlD domain-containing protein [Anaerolineales bacterium]|nr:AzlD domain-containing protein [Anaerolineales bacterium]
MEAWLILLGGGLLTYLTRLSFILLLERVAVPSLLRRALTYIPVAVFSAIIFQMVFVPEGSALVTWQNPRLLSGVLAAAVAWRTKSVLLTILVGMAALFLAGALL